MKPNWRKNYLRYKSYFLNVVANYNQRGELKVYLELILSLLTISIFSVFALRPTLLTIGTLVKDIQVKKETITKLDDKIKQLDQAHIIYNQNRSNIDILNIAIPDNAQPDVLFRQVNALAVKYQLGSVKAVINEVPIKGNPLTLVQKKKETSTLPVGAKGISFDLSAEVPVNSYASVTQFLNDLEVLRTPITFDSIGLTSNLKAAVFTSLQGENVNGQQKIQVLDLSIRGEVPYLPNNK